jgi:arylsulfatase A-like enzyme
MVLLWLLTLSCSDGDTPTAGTPQAPSALGALGPDDLVSLDLPATSRLNKNPVSQDHRPVRDFKERRTVGRVTEWVGAHPYAALSGVREAPVGLEVRLGDGEPLEFERAAVKKPRLGTWALTPREVVVRLPAGQPPPALDDVTLTWPAATDKESGLNLALSGLEPEAFAFRQARVGGLTHQGLLLPAPGEAVFELTVPEGAVLDTRATILFPEVFERRRSDGASLIVSVDDGSGPIEASRRDLAAREPVDVRVDLATWAGKTVKLILATDPGESPQMDYVFLTAPAVVVPTTEPRRVVLVFIDTLRPDHLGVYGYERDTSPRLDAWAQDAAVFDQARSVSSWTLPSSRAALSGRQPEAWADAETLPEAFAAEGWLTGAFVANHLLTPGFDMTRGWAHHDYWGSNPAPKRVEAAQAWLAAHPDRDALVLLHLMDPHLPYSEPEPFASKWAGETPAKLKRGITRSGMAVLERKGMEPDEQAAVRTYTKDRYDQNIAFTDDALGTFLEGLDDSTTVIVFADHGEEFWEHGGFEHGHSLYDELVRVPLIIKGPGVDAGRHDTPVSLLDIAPTARALAGVSAGETDGASLVGLLGGEALAPRVLGLGRSYYTPDLWGAVGGGQKWITGDGGQELYALASDPGEQQDLAEQGGLEAWPAQASGALGLPIESVIRLRARGRASEQPVSLTVTHPAGITRWWPAYDYRGDFSPYQSEVSLTDGVLTIRQEPGQAPRPELYVQVGGETQDVSLLDMTLTVGNQTFEDRGNATKVIGKGQTRWNADPAWTAVLHDAEAAEFSPDSLQELRALGYIE